MGKDDKMENVYSTQLLFYMIIGMTDVQVIPGPFEQCEPSLASTKGKEILSNTTCDMTKKECVCSLHHQSWKWELMFIEDANRLAVPIPADFLWRLRRFKKGYSNHGLAQWVILPLPSPAKRSQETARNAETTPPHYAATPALGTPLAVTEQRFSCVQGELTLFCRLFRDSQHNKRRKWSTGSLGQNQFSLETIWFWKPSFCLKGLIGTRIPHETLWICRCYLRSKGDWREPRNTPHVRHPQQLT